MEEVLNITKFPDSLELDFGGTRKGGKVYFNASKPEEAKVRITNMKVIALHAEEELALFKKEVGEKSED